MSLQTRIYRLGVPPAMLLLHLARPFSAKLRAGLTGRRGLLDRVAAAASQLQGCVWIHATSVGEYEQARPVIQALRDRPDGSPPIAVTHFSPSGYDYAQKRPSADYHDYLPLDRRSSMRRVFSLWRPRLLVFVKFDCWPNQILAAAEQGVPILLIAGTLQPRSQRLAGWARGFWRDLFDRFAHLGVCTTADRERFVRGLGVTSPVTVTGDTRAEQVILRYEAAGKSAVASRLQDLGGRLLILGSTWPPDEALWLPVLPDLLQAYPDLRVVLAPHEPIPARLLALEGEMQRRGIGVCRLSRLMTSRDPLPAAQRCILVDSVGVLADIYRAGCLAYVGGSFTTGVHNTMEPAVAALPVMFGPVIQNAMEATDLVEQQAGFVVPEPAEALRIARQLLGDPSRLESAGQAARQVVLKQRGATEKSLALLDPYL